MAQCPLPPAGTHYASGPDTRGTLDILYTCISVIVLSTWNVLHLNVPLRSYPQNWKQRFRRNVITATTKTFWMFLNVVSPELLIARSLEQRLLARKMSRNVQTFVDQDQVDWSMSHSFFAGMRGFEIVFSEGETIMEESLRATDRSYGDPLREKPLLRRNAARSIALIGAGLVQLGLMSQWPNNLEPALGGPKGGDYYAVVERRTNLLQCESHGKDEEEIPSVGAPTNTEPHQADLSSDLDHQPTSVTESDPPSAEIALSDINLCRLAITNNRFSSSAKWLGPIAWQPDVRNWSTVVKALSRLPSRNLTAKQHSVLRRNITALQGSSWRPNAEQLLLARKTNIISKLPHLPADDLEDRSQSDEILKFLSTCQILWLVAQVIARGTAKLPVSQMEIIALALAACALIIYVLLWAKPQDVRTTVRVTAARYPSPDEVITSALAGITFPPEGGFLGSPIVSTIGDNGIAGTSSEHYARAYAVGLVIGSTIFGSFHLIPWNFAFPTNIERTLWRVSALITTFSPALLFPLYSVVEKSLLHHRRKKTTVYLALYDLGRGAEFVFSSMYIAARVFSLVECVRSLFFLPPEAFRTSWLNFLPHFG